jgi:hypothetical protein
MRTYALVLVLDPPVLPVCLSIRIWFRFDVGCAPALRTIHGVNPVDHIGCPAESSMSSALLKVNLSAYGRHAGSLVSTSA